MKNEFGTPLDRNGYAPTIIPWQTGVCFLCQRPASLEGRLQRHEIFHGSLYRGRSKELGLWVSLCHECHHALHNTTPEMDKALKRTGQKVAMRLYGWTVDDFRKRFGKSYLEGNE